MQILLYPLFGRFSTCVIIKIRVKYAHKTGNFGAFAWICARRMNVLTVVASTQYTENSKSG